MEPTTKTASKPDFITPAEESPKIHSNQFATLFLSTTVQCILLNTK